MGQMFERLKNFFGRRNHSGVAEVSTSVVVPQVQPDTQPQGLATEDEIVSALAYASQSQTEQSALDSETERAVSEIATELVANPPSLKRGNPGGQELVVRITYNQKEWIENTYPGYARTHGLPPFQRVAQVFVERYIRAVEERVNPPAAYSAGYEVGEEA